MSIVNFRVLVALVFSLIVATPHLVFARNQENVATPSHGDAAGYRFVSPTQNNIAQPPRSSGDPRCKELSAALDRPTSLAPGNPEVVKKYRPDGQPYNALVEKTVNPRNDLQAEYHRRGCR
ncbi:hypothetical protein [Paraburkholderia flava]|uniref:hypothetical protein n=1 Tax=Paraburkholderia flava TaxID=2547393 RepID=UPI001060B5B7|nr:hypothetical protein [Paraburkholderia flava]